MAGISNVLTRFIGRTRFRPSTADVSLHVGLAKRVVEDITSRLGQPCDLVDVNATRTGSLTIRVQADRAYFAKLPLQASTEPRLRQNAHTLQSLAQATWMTPFLSSRCPTIVLTGTAENHFYSVETGVAGRDGATILKAGGSSHDMILSAERFLAKLQKASAQTESLRRPRWEEGFASAVQRVEQLAAQAGSADAYNQLIRDIKARLSKQVVPSVYSHGNFWLGNMLFNDAGTLTGVIDWDCADDCSLPALDLIYLLVRTHAQARSTPFGEALADWIDADSLPFLDACLARHCHELSIAASLVVPLSYCSWIQHLDAHCRYSTPTSTDTRWLTRNVCQVLDRWHLWNVAGRRTDHRWQRVR
jgi:aminoglycoside phosphotransferase (APT) family kinase protein